MVSRYFPVQEIGRKTGAGGGSRTHTGRLSPADFHTVYGFRRPDDCGAQSSGLRSGLSLHLPPEDPASLKLRRDTVRGLGAARLVSTPSLSQGLGSGLPLQVSPNLSSSASPVSQASTQVFLKSAASAIPPRPHGWPQLSIIRQPSGIYTSGPGADGRGRFCVLVCVRGWLLLVFLAFGLMTLIAAASRLVLMCVA